jgi:hypothetical protein
MQTCGSLPACNNDKLMRTNYLKNNKRTRNMIKDIPPSPLILPTNIKL